MRISTLNVNCFGETKGLISKPKGLNHFFQKMLPKLLETKDDLLICQEVKKGFFPENLPLEFKKNYQLHFPVNRDHGNSGQTNWTVAFTLKPSQWQAVVPTRLDFSLAQRYKPVADQKPYSNKVVELFHKEKNLSLLGLHMAGGVADANIMWDDLLLENLRKHDFTFLVGDFNANPLLGGMHHKPTSLLDLDYQNLIPFTEPTYLKKKTESSIDNIYIHKTAIPEGIPYPICFPPQICSQDWTDHHLCTIEVTQI